MARQASSIVSTLASSTGAVASTELPLDPFLSGLSDHQRQESADSGLGMAVPQSYSMPHTPEDFLAGMDDRMDCSSEAGANMDSTDIALGDNIDPTDDLVPSLQVLYLTLALLLTIWTNSIRTANSSALKCNHFNNFAMYRCYDILIILHGLILANEEIRDRVWNLLYVPS